MTKISKGWQSIAKYSVDNFIIILFVVLNSSVMANFCKINWASPEMGYGEGDRIRPIGALSFATVESYFRMYLSIVSLTYYNSLISFRVCFVQRGGLSSLHKTGGQNFP